MNCGVGHRPGLDPALLWLWCRLVVTVQIGPLAWEPPCLRCGPKTAKRKKKEKKENVFIFLILFSFVYFQFLNITKLMYEQYDLLGNFLPVSLAHY